MNPFYLYFTLGWQHVLDFEGYDHILFLVGLIAPYGYQNAKKIFLLVSFFTIGHTLALLLSVYGVLSFQASWIELLIPITIIITALYHIITAGKNTHKEPLTFLATTTITFGIIHGFGFSNYFKTIMPGTTTEKLKIVAPFAIGIEVAQLAVVIVALTITYLLQSLFRYSPKEITLLVAALVIGVALPMLQSRL